MSLASRASCGERQEELEQVLKILGGRAGVCVAHPGVAVVAQAPGAAISLASYPELQSFVSSLGKASWVQGRKGFGLRRWRNPLERLHQLDSMIDLGWYQWLWWLPSGTP